MTSTHSGASSRASRVGWLLCGVATLLALLAIVLFVLNRDTSVPESWSIAAGTRPGLFDFVRMAFTTLLFTVPPSAIGALILSRHPQHRIGWMLCWIGVAFGANFLIQESIIYTNFTAPERFPGRLYVAWVANWIWPVPPTLALLIVLIFPDGHLPPARWRWVLWSSLLFAATVMVIGVVEQPLASAFDLDNPFAPFPVSEPLALLDGLAFPFLVVAVLGTFVAVGFRFRRSDRNERQQFKWLLAGLLLSVMSLAIGFTFDSRLGELMINWMFVYPMLSIGLAVLRFRLYDVDILINRALVYAALTGILILVYLGSVVLLQALFHTLTAQDSQLAVVISTLAIAALFNPLRRRIQAFIDRRFYRRRYDAQQVLAAFGASLRERDNADLDRLTGELLGVIQETMQPAHLSLWLREPEHKTVAP